MDLESAIRERYLNLEWALDERLRRLYAAAEAKAIGHGGVTLVWKATGVARGSIKQGLKELVERPDAMEGDMRRMRRVGAGRKTSVADDVELLSALEHLVEPVTRGDHESHLRWTCKSLRQLESELVSQGYNVSHTSIGSLLKKLGYTLQGNRKKPEGTKHSDRNAQYEYINTRVEEAVRNGQPVISVDTKKKQLVSQIKNGRKEWRPQGDPEQVSVYDFVDKVLGRANPHGIYDLAGNAGWVSIGTDHETASFAVSTIRRWWVVIGKPLYPDAKELVITADGGGSNGSRVRLWRFELQQLSDELGISIRFSHFPPGTSKWNRIENRLFSHISMNWRGKTLVSHEVTVDLIAATTTRNRLNVRAELDSKPYPKGIQATAEDFAEKQILRDEFHGEWNYPITPSTAK